MLPNKAMALLVGLWFSWSLAVAGDAPTAPQTPSDPVSFERPIAVPKVAPGSIPTPLFNSGAVAVAPNDDREKEAAARERIKTANDESMMNATWTMARWTIVMAVIAAVQVAMFLIQLRLTFKAVSDAKVAAIAAKNSAESIPRIERAYLFASISFAGALGPIDRNDAYYDAADPRVVGTIRVKFRNYGKTPAVLTHVDRYPEYGKLAPQRLVNQRENLIRIPDGIVVGAGRTYRTSISLNFDKVRWDQLKSQTLTMYCVGSVAYDDVFGNPHSTSFCWNAFDLETDAPGFSITRSTELNKRT